jgi:hypothetical protein
MAHRGPININGLPIESQEFLAGLRPANSRFAGWRWALDGDDDGDKDGDTGDTGGDGDKDGDKSGDGDDGDSGSDTVSKDEFERLRRRMEAADRRASEAEKKIKDAEDAKKDDLTKAQEAQTEAEDKIKGLEKQVSDLRLENAFLVANKHSWHDPEVALGLARTKGYLEDVTDDDGEVDKKALKKALDRLATEHKYLIKSEKKSDDSPDGPSGEPGGKRSTNQDDDKAKKAQLKSRFPILNGR